MLIGILIVSRILVAVCLVFILSYIFSSSAKSATFTLFTKIAAILMVVLFIATNILIFRGGRIRDRRSIHNWGYDRCDSTQRK